MSNTCFSCTLFQTWFQKLLPKRILKIYLNVKQRDFGICNYYIPKQEESGTSNTFRNTFLTMDCFPRVDCNLDISLLSEDKQVSVDLTSLLTARPTIVNSNSFTIVNRGDILIWQNREEVFISLNEFQTIGCTKNVASY